MGGLNASDRLRASGIDASKDTAVKVPPEQLHILERGHALFDPRSEWPVDEELAKALDSGTVKPHIAVRDNGVIQGVRDLQVIDGTRRTLAGRLVNEWREKRGDPALRMVLDFVTGDDREMLRLRLQLNGRRKDETTSTLAYKFDQGTKMGLTAEELAGAYGCPASLVADLLLFANFVPEVKVVFDEALPMEAVGAFADVPREEQAAVLATVIGSGAKTPRKIKKEVKKARGEAKPAEPRMRSRKALTELLGKLETGSHMAGEAAVLRYVLGGEPNEWLAKLVGGEQQKAAA